MVASMDAGFLPSIKCSNCGVNVEISNMGDHVCEGTNSLLILVKLHMGQTNPCDSYIGSSAAAAKIKRLFSCRIQGEIGPSSSY